MENSRARVRVRLHVMFPMHSVRKCICTVIVLSRFHLPIKNKIHEVRKFCAIKSNRCRCIFTMASVTGMRVNSIRIQRQLSLTFCLPNVENYRNQSAVNRMDAISIIYHFDDKNFVDPMRIFSLN